ncbi:MAG: UDP-N-acetylmuramate--L-alanine ligase [Parcubacteria group bacterium]
MDLTKYKNVFVCDIGGIGVSAVARFLRSKGIAVTGSEPVKSELTEKLESEGVKIYYEQKAENVTFMYDLFVYSAAATADHPERVKAKELGIPQKSYFEFVGEMSRDYQTIAVSGTNGKSTTTAMIAGILIDAQKDPTVIVGSKFEKLNDNFRLGNSDLFLVEACEYRAHMLLIKPEKIVLTNIEEEHLDFFKDLNHIIQTFQQYVNNLRNEDNLLVYNNDDVNIRKLILPKCRRVSYGLIHGANVWADNIRKLPGKQLFEVVYYGQNLGEFELPVPGDFNIYNALAAIAFCLSLDIPLVVIKKSLAEYRGIWRRFEIVKNDKITVISDYAHHPTAVRSTLKAAREFFPGRRIVAVFQPHQHSRTKKLFNDFLKSFESADVVVISEIFDVAGREVEDTEISSKDLVDTIHATEPNKPVFFAIDLNETVEKVNALVRDEDVVLVMGAGDIYKINAKIKVQNAK